MNGIVLRHVVLSVGILAAASARSLAQQPRPAPSVDAQSAATDPSGQTGWPEPIADRATFGYLLFDNAEFQQATGPDAFRWDALGWRGGDVHRFWFKSEGRLATASSEGSEFEVQALYGKLISPFFDLQAGVRIDQRIRSGSDPTRVYAVVGLQGLSPYRFDIEPTLFLSQKGLSGRFTATYDLSLSQRLIVQPRFETNVAAQRDDEIGVGAGWNDAELGVRLRYEVRREFAPYIGITWKDSFGATHQLTTQVGGDPSHFVVAIGARAWF